MKIVRIAAIGLGIAIALALLAWYLRDTLIREISNPLLQEYGLEVTDVSLDALATSDASIGYLELSYEGGTVIAIDGLTLPITGAADGLKTYTARSVSIAMADTGEEPLELAPLIDRFLSLANELAGNEFRVTELQLPPYPTIYDLRWVLTGDEQSLEARVDSVSMSARVRGTGPATHTVDVSLPAGRISAGLKRSDSGYSLSGSSDLDLPAWSPLAKLAGIVPGEINVDAGTGRLTLDVDIPFDVGSPPTALVELAPLSPLRLAYMHESGEMTSIVIQTGSPMRIDGVFPEVDWTLRQANSSLQVSYDDWRDVPLTISDVLCKPGPECSMAARAKMEDAVLPFGEVGEADLSALVDVAFTDSGVRLGLQPGAVMELRRIDTSGFSADRIEARMVSSGSLEIVDAGWSLAADSIDGSVEDLRTADDIGVAAPVFLESVAFSELEEAPRAEVEIYVPKILVQWRDRSIDLAGMKGALSLRGDAVQAELTTVGLHQDGPLRLKHDLQTGDGMLRLDDAIVSFGAKTLSDRITPWNAEWDLGGGTVTAVVAAEWRDSGQVLQGKASAIISDLSGFYEDSAFADLSTALDVEYTADGNLTAAPATLTVGLVEVGMPITDISADYVLDPGASSVAVENLRMAAFGGEIRAEPFSFRTDRARNTLVLHAKSIEMDELLTVKEFEAIEVSGSVRAELPVTIEGGTVTIANGTLAGEPPGGVIRYLPGTPPDDTDASSLAFVRRVLSNFEYKSLDSVVDYTEGGDLKLQLRLEGRNPDLDETRPVVLNLGVENNVPQMLRSLRATRAVEEVLEHRFQQQRDDGK